MSPLGITTALATEEDASSLASIMTAAFASSDAAYPLIWGQVGDSVHDAVSLRGLFTPVQREARLTFKAMDGEKLVGFATWNLPEADAPKRKDVDIEAARKSAGLPEIPGVNTALWNEKALEPREAYYRDAEPSEDIFLLFCFVHPEYQRRGIGSLLTQWGLEKADELKTKLWVTSTPQAVRTYEKSGWKVVQRFDLDLQKYGGQGIYSRAWMLRVPN